MIEPYDICYDLSFVMGQSDDLCCHYDVVGPFSYISHGNVFAAIMKY